MKEHKIQELLTQRDYVLRRRILGANYVTHSHKVLEEQDEINRTVAHIDNQLWQLGYTDRFINPNRISA